MIMNNFSRNFVGLDKFLADIEKELSQNTNFPPYNIIQFGKDKFRVELAVAGYNKDELSVTIKDKILTIVGEGKEKCASSEDGHYLHRGIAKRNFTRAFALGDYIEIENASYSEGILTIDMKVVIPEDKKPRVIEIS